MSAPGIYLQPMILYLQSITLQDILTSIDNVDIKDSKHFINIILGSYIISYIQERVTNTKMI